MSTIDTVESLEDGSKRRLAWDTDLVMALREFFDSTTPVTYVSCCGRSYRRDTAYVLYYLMSAQTSVSQAVTSRYWEALQWFLDVRAKRLAYLTSNTAGPAT